LSLKTKIAVEEDNTR